MLLLADFGGLLTTRCLDVSDEGVGSCVDVVAVQDHGGVLQDVLQAPGEGWTEPMRSGWVRSVLRLTRSGEGA
jgi:hypothetical protein